MDAVTLHKAISDVSPISSCSVGNGNDRTTWTWVPGDGATQTQIDAGNNAIATIPLDYKPTPEVDPATAALFDHENRILSLEGKPQITAADFADKVAEIDVKAGGIAINKVSNVAGG